MASELERVGFVGLGQIGEPMARTLCGGEFEVVVYDLVEEAIARVVEAGAQAAASCREVAERCDVVGVCVVDDAATEAVVAGPGGLLEGARKGLVIAIHSTVHPDTAKRLALQAAESGVSVIDAQMTGGAAAAAAGTLRFMAGGPADALARCRPMLEVMASEITECGGIGMGGLAKLCNNLAQFVAWFGLIEAARLADHGGLEREKLLEVLSWTMNDNARMFLATRSVLEKDPENEVLVKAFTAAMRLAEKDLGLALAVGRGAGIAMPITGHAEQDVARLFAVPDPKRR